jgi:hypothetical protein
MAGGEDNHARVMVGLFAHVIEQRRTGVCVR